jgi:hypothetical protein|tara:strand:- start:356 stop:571 length:216 start_codon:yes stop_codon:yes gene_type:complete
MTFEEVKKKYPWITLSGYLTALKISKKFKVPVEEYIADEEIEKTESEKMQEELEPIPPAVKGQNGRKKKKG